MRLRRRDRTMLKIGGACGIATLLVFPMILLAIYLSPWFSWTDNALSDLGVSGLAATIFNSSLIVAGVLGLIFSFGLERVLSESHSRVGLVLYMLASLSLVGIGLFPETVKPWHFYFSVAFFLFLSLSLLANGISLTFSSRGTGLFTLLLGIVSGVAWLLPHRGVAIPEFIAALSGSTWSAVMGWRILRQGQL